MLKDEKGKVRWAMILPLEKQVVSLELSKQLKEAGYPQDGLWYWTKYFHVERYELVPKDPNAPHGQYFIAPTVAELLNRLDKEVTIPKGLSDVADFLAKEWLCLKKNIQ